MVAWLTVKTCAIFFGIATTAFCISTIVLAVQKADLERDLEDVRDKLDQLSADTTTTSTTAIASTASTPSGGDTSPGGNTSPSGEVTTPSGEVTTPSGEVTTPSGEVTTPSSSSTSTANPIYPTLPTGLPDPEQKITAERVAIFFGLLSTGLALALAVVLVHRSSLLLKLDEAYEKLDVLEDYIQSNVLRDISGRVNAHKS